MNKFLIYLFCDDYKVNDIILSSFIKFNFSIKSFDNEEQFFKEFKDVKPNLILLDFAYGEANNLTILKTIRDDIANENISILVLNPSGDINVKLDLLNSGADDVIYVPFDIRELISRVNIHYRKFLNSKFIIKINDLYLDRKNEMLFKFDEQIYLTKSEFKIIDFLFRNRGKIVSREELYNVIWGIDNCINSRTVDMHIKSIREKIGDTNKNFILSIYGQGYKIE